MYLRDGLQEKLPPDLVAVAEEEAVSIGAGRPGASYRPDVQVVEPWKLKEPASMAVAGAPSGPIATEPIRVAIEEEVERWIEIRESTGRLITALELLSPSNKCDAVERDRYLRKRGHYISGGASFVEIDLVRQGTWLFPTVVRRVLERAGAAYGICVFRATRRDEHEVYPIRLREPLPGIRIPLRATDADVILNLQALVDQCHERGRYHLLDYTAHLAPPLSSEDATWAAQRLAQAGLT